MSVNILLFIESGNLLEGKLKKLKNFNTSVYNIPMVPDFLSEIDLIIISSNFCDNTEKVQAFVNLLRQDFKKPVVEFVRVKEGNQLPPKLVLCNRHFYNENKLLLWLSTAFTN